MKLAVLTESPADEAAICILVAALLGEEIEPIPRRARAGGWNAAVATIPATLRELHYRRTASALVVAIDSDDSVVHKSEHEFPGQAVANCRFCQLKATVGSTLSQLQPQSPYQPVDAAIAVAVPSIEGWYLCGRECTEAGWIAKQGQGKRAKAEISRLKQLVYGTDRPSLQLEVDCAARHARALAADLQLLENFFPQSFGRFAAEVRSWRPR